MTLEESKEMLKEMKENATHYKKDITIQSVFEALEDTEKAVDIILNYIEHESIPKEKVRKKIEECVKRRQELANGHFWESPSNINEDTAIVIAQTLYQELLGE